MVEVCIPELELVRVAQMVCIGCEIAQAHKQSWADPELRRQLNPDTRGTMANATRFLATDFLQVLCTRCVFRNLIPRKTGNSVTAQGRVSLHLCHQFAAFCGHAEADSNVRLTGGESFGWKWGGSNSHRS